MAITVSAIVPAYNCEATLERALESIVNQNVPPDEIVVVNDGSVDKTAEVMERCAQKYPMVRLVTQENAGPGAARNHGVKLAKGEWIAFLDSDDQWHPWHLENLIKILEDHPELSWASAAYENNMGDPKKIQVFGDDPSLQTVIPSFLATTGKVEPAVNTNTVLIRRSAFEACGGFRESWLRGEDIWLWYELGMRYPQLGYSTVPSTLYYYCASSITNRYLSVEEDLNERVERLDQMIEEAKSLGVFDREDVKLFLGFHVNVVVRMALTISNRGYREMRAKYRPLLPYVHLSPRVRVAAFFAKFGISISSFYWILIKLRLMRPVNKFMLEEKKDESSNDPA